MKTNVLLLFYLLIFSSALCQSEIKSEPCNDWYLMPLLYNNVISESNVVNYWENYWYYWTGDTTKFIPDTLFVKLELVPSLSILSENTIPNAEYKLFSTIQLKYGDYEDSYYVVNPKLTEPITLFSKNIDLKLFFDSFINTNSMGYTLYTQGIPIKEILEDYNIYTHDKPADYSKGKLYYLNQIIINAFFIDEESNIKCWSEFIFPINGAYGNEKGCCKWGF